MSGIDADTPSTLIHLICAASADPSKWQAFLDRFTTVVDAAGTVLFMHDFDDSTVVRQEPPVFCKNRTRTMNRGSFIVQ